MDFQNTAEDLKTHPSEPNDLLKISGTTMSGEDGGGSMVFQNAATL
jgi:hypothetical protein